MNQVFLSLGGNIGNLTHNFRKAGKLIEKEIGEIVRHSSVYSTPPLGFNSEDYFHNQVLEIRTNLTPEELLENILFIENRLGRTRTPGIYTSRTMDIDILYFNDRIINNNRLIIPHPRIAERRFVLVPLVEIEPDFIHPVFLMSNFQLLHACSDMSDIKKADQTSF
jgi:2-amino-4-hydroxy-6-hydroxymethyldihydropteridine diphosphokinase